MKLKVQTGLYSAKLTSYTCQVEGVRHKGLIYILYKACLKQKPGIFSVDVNGTPMTVLQRHIV